MGRESKDIDVAVDNMMGKKFAEYVKRYAWLGKLNKIMIEWQMENPEATKEQATEFAKEYYESNSLDKMAGLSTRDCAVKLSERAQQSLLIK